MNYIYKACLFTSNPLKMENWSGVTDPSRTHSQTIKIELVNFLNNRKFRLSNATTMLRNDKKKTPKRSEKNANGKKCLTYQGDISEVIVFIEGCEEY